MWKCKILSSRKFKGRSHYFSYPISFLSVKIHYHQHAKLNTSCANIAKHMEMNPGLPWRTVNSLTWEWGNFFQFLSFFFSLLASLKQIEN